MLAHAFIDGDYFRMMAKECHEELGLYDPIRFLWEMERLNQMVFNVSTIRRFTYYDAEPDKGEPSKPTDSDLREYWDKLELLRDVHLGFGKLRGRQRKEPRQKAVDTLLSVDMLVGAFTGIFDTAVLVAGDADYVPVVEETLRCGVQVIVIASERSLADDLRRRADRVFCVGPETARGVFHLLN